MAKAKTSMRNKTAVKHKHKKVHAFRSADYLSGDGMVTSTWGPAKWHTMHAESFNYPVHPTREQMRQYRAALLHLQHVLPCGKCRVNFTANLRRLPPDWHHFASRNSYSKYIYRLHEVVNEMLGKTSGLSFADVRERYENFRARCTTTNANAPTDASTNQQTNLLNRSRTQKKLLKRTPESGCTEALHGQKSRCIIHIVPFESVGPSMQIHHGCMRKGGEN